MVRSQKVMARKRLEEAALKVSLVASQAMAGKIDLSRAEITKLLDANMVLVKYHKKLK
jgi:hypothetical protein